MTSISAQSFGINLRALKTLCLYSNKKYTFFRKIRAYVLFSFCVFHVPILGTLYFLLQEEIDMKRLSDNAFVFAELSCYILKLLPFITNADEIQKCIHYFETSKYIRVRKTQEPIIAKASAICRRNSYAFIIGLIGGYFSWALQPLFSSEVRKLPSDIWVPFNYRENFYSYCLIYFWVVIGVGYPAVASSAVDPLVAGLAALAAGYFKVLKDNLQHLAKYTLASSNTNDHFLSTEEANILNKEIKKSTKHHIALIKFVVLYEKCFSQVVFSQFVGSIFVLSFCCLQLTMLTPFSLEFFTTINYLGILLTQIYFYCYYGSNLFEESNSLVNAIYMGEWYRYDVKSKKALILIMERAKNPVVLTAGKLLDLSLDTFTTILRRSYSFLAVLLNKQI